jgi:PIN like domain
VSATYFFDNNIAPAIPEALRALREQTVHICDCAEQGISRGDADTEWMPKVARLGWFAVTVDNNIQRRREEKRVREECGLRVVYLPGTFGRKLHFFQQAVFVIRAWENIAEATKGARAGQCFRVTENHRVTTMP